MNARILIRLFSAGVALTCILWRASAQDSPTKCDWAAFERSATEMRAARDAAMKISESEGNTEVPPEAIQQIQEFKNDLYAALQSYFACQPNRLPEGPALERSLYAHLAIPVLTPPQKEADFDANGRGPWTGLYLGDVVIKAEITSDTRRLAAVLTRFSIPYGDDAELDVFDLGKSDVWSPVIHFTSKPYNSISGAFHAFDYRISPSSPEDDWFVVATHVNPWPASCWQNLFVDAVRPKDIGFEYQWFHDKQYGYVCDDVPPYIRSVRADEFQIRFAITSIDEGQLSSVSVMTYRVGGDEVTRVQPVALNPVNFVDGWVRGTWRDAEDWSAPGNLPRLRNMHIKLHGQSFGDFIAFRGCAIASLSEVKFASNDGDGPDYFFLVKQAADSFTMLRVSNHATGTCKGRDQLAEVSDR